MYDALVPFSEFRNRFVASRSSAYGRKKTAPVRALSPIRKAPTGIRGLDEISGGGLPKGRTTIICGGLG